MRVNIQSILRVFCFINISIKLPKNLLHMNPKMRQIWHLLICVHHTKCNFSDFYVIYLNAMGIILIYIYIQITNSIVSLPTTEI